MGVKLKHNEFSAIVNDINQVTVPKDFRIINNISVRDEIILKFTGKVSKKRVDVKPIQEVNKEEINRGK